MKSFKAGIHIDASPDAVWRVLTDASRWTDWNSTVSRIEGSIAPGAPVTVYPAINPDRAFPVRVSRFDAPRLMVWTGGLPLGLFKGERSYRLSPAPKGVHFAMEETFTGLLSPLITKSIPDMQPVFEEFAAALKRWCERGT